MSLAPRVKQHASYNTPVRSRFCAWAFDNRWMWHSTDFLFQCLSALLYLEWPLHYRSSTDSPLSHHSARFTTSLFTFDRSQNPISSKIPVHSVLCILWGSNSCLLWDLYLWRTDYASFVKAPLLVSRSQPRCIYHGSVLVLRTNLFQSSSYLNLLVPTFLLYFTPL